MTDQGEAMVSWKSMGHILLSCGRAENREESLDVNGAGAEASGKVAAIGGWLGSRHAGNLGKCDALDPRSTTLSVTIDRPWQAVYAFASDPANMHHWAAGLGSRFERDGDEWVVRDPAENWCGCALPDRTLMGARPRRDCRWAGGAYRYAGGAELRRGRSDVSAARDAGHVRR